MLSSRLIHRAVLLTAILALLLPTGWIEHYILTKTNGTIVYPFDNTFFPLTVAKNFAFDHVWGISSHYFTSASPSLLYTFLLAVVFLITGAYLIVPLIVNSILAILFIRAAQRRLIREQIRSTPQLLILVAVILLTPLPLLVMSGSEKTLVLLLTFLFIDNCAHALAHGKFPPRLYIYGLLMASTSYETLPVLVIACILLAIQRRWWEGAKLLFISALPIYLFGLASITKNHYFIPNPILLTLQQHPGDLISDTAPWLIAGSIILFGILLAKNPQNLRLRISRRALYPLTALLALALTPRTANLYTRTVKTSIDSYDQQYQVAKFVRAYYYKHGVASNEIGTLSFWAEQGRVFDLAGYGDLEVLQNICNHTWTPAFADSLSEKRNINIAILHHTWSDPEVEPYWYRIATWQNRKDTVSFYSIDRRYISQLQENLHAFEPRLPHDVTVRYYAPID